MQEAKSGGQNYRFKLASAAPDRGTGCWLLFAVTGLATMPGDRVFGYLPGRGGLDTRLPWPKYKTNALQVL